MQISFGDYGWREALFSLLWVFSCNAFYLLGKNRLVFGEVERPARILCYVSLGTEHMCSSSEPKFWVTGLIMAAPSGNCWGDYTKVLCMQKVLNPSYFPSLFISAPTTQRGILSIRAAEQLPTMRFLSYGVNCFHLSARTEAL